MIFRRLSLNARVIAAIATTTALVSAWWLVPKVARSDSSARLGIIRGQLWLNEGIASANNKGYATTETEAAIRNAVGLAPANSAAWLALALATERKDWVDRRAAAALKMSYYTGFNERSMIAPRLELLARTDLGRDTELRDILKRQLRVIIARAPDLKPAIASAYTSGTQVNRKLIESELADLDPALLGTVRSSR